jgi:hypothetical protein
LTGAVVGGRAVPGARTVVVMTDRIGNVTRQRYEQIVTQAKDLIAQVAKA